METLVRVSLKLAIVVVAVIVVIIADAVDVAAVCVACRRGRCGFRRRLDMSKLVDGSNQYANQTGQNYDTVCVLVVRIG